MAAFHDDVHALTFCAMQHHAAGGTSGTIGASMCPGVSTKVAEGLHSSYPSFPLPFCAHAHPLLLVISASPY